MHYVSVRDTFIECICVRVSPVSILNVYIHTSIHAYMPCSALCSDLGIRVQNKAHSSQSQLSFLRIICIAIILILIICMPIAAACPFRGNIQVGCLFSKPIIIALPFLPKFSSKNVSTMPARGGGVAYKATTTTWSSTLQLRHAGLRILTLE